jgi:hypothetical protein
MTSTKELETLVATITAKGARATVEYSNGEISSVEIRGAKGIGPCPMAPIHAAERMREFLRALETKEARLSKLLKETRQYVSNAGTDEDPETQRNAAALVLEIDAALKERG